MPLLWRCLALFPISRLLGISRDNERLLFLSNACELCQLCLQRHEVEQRQESRQKRTKSTKICTQDSTKTNLQLTKPFATSDILDTTEMGRDTESLLRSHRCDERSGRWKIRIFLAHVCQGLSLLPSWDCLAFGLLE